MLDRQRGKVGVWDKIRTRSPVPQEGPQELSVLGRRLRNPGPRVVEPLLHLLPRCLYR